MKRVLPSLLCLAIILLSPAVVAAQGSAVAEVRATIDRLFEGMQQADSAKVRSMLAEGVRFAQARTAAGVTQVAYQEVDGWLRAIADSGGRWREQLFDTEIRVDGNIASVWAGYNFYLDGALRHCGTDSIELVRTDQGWKITQLADTQRREGCTAR